jgi:hypothetical protein
MVKLSVCKFDYTRNDKYLLLESSNRREWKNKHFIQELSTLNCYFLFL